MHLLNQLWHTFWFKAESPAPVCIFRILLGVLVLVCGLFWIPNLPNFFGPRALTSAQTIQEYEHGPRFSLFFILPQNEPVMVAIFIVLMVSALCTTLGVYTRASLIVLFTCLVSFHHRNPTILHSGDTLLRIFAFLLIFAPCGAMFSLDQFWKRSDISQIWEIRYPVWPQRLMQLQIAAVYCQAFWSKLGGETWRDGTAVYYVSRLEEFSRFSIPYVFDHLWTCQLLTWGTLGIEFALWTLVWIKGLRYYVLLAGIALHAGIEWTMNIPLFEYIMVASYINFVSSEDLKKVLEKTKKVWSFISAQILAPEKETRRK